MLIIGTAEVHGVNETNWKSRPLRSYVMTKKTNDVYYVSLKNSLFPNSTEYRVSDIETVHDKFTAEGKLGLQFKKPKHVMLIQADNKKALQMFARQIHDIIRGKNVAIVSRHMPKAMPTKKVVTNCFDPSNVEYNARTNHFDSRILNMVNLSKLVLDNCTMFSMPEQIGNLPIEYFSLNNIRVPSTGLRRDRDMFWDWMCMDTISNTLKTLKMNKIGLNMLPFELMYLTKLETLSLANNNLKYLPHFIGNLQKLKNLNVSGNQLRYFPNILIYKYYLQLDISNNKFLSDKSIARKYDIICTYLKSCDRKFSLTEGNVQSLRNLSFYSLFTNGVKYKRQEIPRTLWHLYDVIFPCVCCKKLMLPTNIFLIQTYAHPMASESFIKSPHNDFILYHMIVCQCKRIQQD